MSNEIMIAVLAGLAGMLGWGFADFFAKKTIDSVGDLVTLAWAHIYGVVFISSLALISARANNNLELPVDHVEWLALAFFGVLQAFVYYFAYKAFGKGKLSILNPVFSSYSGIVVLLSVLIFGEVLLRRQIYTLLIVFLGIIIMNLDHESLALKKIKLARLSGMKEMLTAVIFASIWTVLWGHFVSGKNWLTYAAIMYIFMSITILFICLFQKAKLNVLNRYTWKYFFLIGVTEVVAYVGVSLGYSLSSHTSIVAVLSAAFSFPTFILAYLFLKERVNKFQVVGAFLVVLGVALVSLS
jgi:drug/metabolite transporter (DMT)-like permease